MIHRRFAKIVALALALAWLPMSSFAQMCATHSVAMKTGGMHHPAMPQTVEELKAVHLDHASLAQGAIAVVIDAETFWHSVDSYDDGCNAKALCAFAGAVAVPIESKSLLVESNMSLEFNQLKLFLSRESAPDPPPPRTLS